MLSRIRIIDLGIAALAVISLFAFEAPRARAGDLPFDTSQYQDALKLADEAFAKGIIKTMGLLSMHRPYQGAATLGSSSAFEIGAEATFVRLPDDFGVALKAAGAPALTTPAIPVPRILLEKGLGENANLGFSYIAYKFFKIYGADFQVSLLKPEEQPWWSLRFTYSMARVSYITAQTFSPQLIVSRPMDFADPYLGLAFIYVNGSFLFDLPQLGSSVEAESSAYSASGIVGVKLRMPGLGIKLALEGSYNISGAHTMGLSTGLGF